MNWGSGTRERRLTIFGPPLPPIDCSAGSWPAGTGRRTPGPWCVLCGARQCAQVVGFGAGGLQGARRWPEGSARGSGGARGRGWVWAADHKPAVPPPTAASLRPLRPYRPHPVRRPCCPFRSGGGARGQATPSGNGRRFLVRVWGRAGRRPVPLPGSLCSCVSLVSFPGNTLRRSSTSSHNGSRHQHHRP